MAKKTTRVEEVQVEPKGFLLEMGKPGHFAALIALARAGDVAAAAMVRQWEAEGAEL